jgi:hypothetical protein
VLRTGAGLMLTLLGFGLLLVLVQRGWDPSVGVLLLRRRAAAEHAEHPGGEDLDAETRA